MGLGDRILDAEVSARAVNIVRFNDTNQVKSAHLLGSEEDHSLS
jgi:hypothetical protein